MNTKNTEHIARERIANAPALAAESDFILSDWPNESEHYYWLTTATVSDILDWVSASK